MKLRILENTLRLRLKKGEVETLGGGASIVAHTSFPGSRFAYRLDVTDGEHAVASFHDGCMAVGLPRDEVRAWAGSDQVSIAAELATGTDGHLSLLVEKDFKCLSPGHHRSGAEDDDTYPHPNEGQGGC